VAVLAYYGGGSCTVIPRAQFTILQSNDVLSIYSQSIPIPPVADWLCHKLQVPFSEYTDVAMLAQAYFALLDNHQSEHKQVIEPAMI
jgi:hypothetical protein